MNKNEFIKECLNINIIITEEIYRKLLSYSDMLIEWNKKFNLTSITKEKEIFLKHFYDSLCLNKATELTSVHTVCDVGSGAGFPGLVLKIVFDNLKITLIESSAKKCLFLNNVIKQLNLTGVEVINERGEIAAKKLREIFDIVTCRAVSSLYIICEICIPMVNVNGFFLPLKANVKEEIIASNNIIRELNSEIENIVEYILPLENSKRTIPIIIKKGVTDKKYPREYNKIIKTS